MSTRQDAGVTPAVHRNRSWTSTALPPAAYRRAASFGRVGAVSRLAARPGGKPPRLALVLGSGGVRSAAAIGVAEVLARERLPVDLIVGCSSGALFGAGLALGLKL